jgi:DNA polymerase elongation subunit (family B)
MKTLGLEDTVWIYSDTDSGIFSLKAFHDNVLSNVNDVQKKVDVIDKFIKTTIDPYVNSVTEDIKSYLNSVENKMVWEREVIAESAVFVAKKRYAMAVWDSEGVRFDPEPKFKIMGLESVRSSTPAWARKFLKECYKTVLMGTEQQIQDMVVEFKKKFYEYTPSEIATPRGVNGLEKFHDKTSIYIKGTPKHVKAALVHNWLVDKKGMSTEKIKSGNKIKYIDLTRPNPINSDVIGFSVHLPKEFGLDSYVDYKSIFDTAFMSPLRIFLNVVGWTEEPIVSLEDFFS